MARTGYTEAERRAKREEFLDAAVQVFENDGGIDAVSFRNVAAVAGCSYSAPYRYFSGKEELICAMRARAYRWLEKALRDAVTPMNGDPRSQLETVANAYIQAGLQRPGMYALMLFQKDSEFAHRSIELKAARHDSLQVCVEVIAAGQASGILPKTTDALTAAHMFWIGAHGLVSLQVGGQFVMGRSVEQLAPILIQWLETGLENHSGEKFEESSAGKFSAQKN